MKQIDNTLKFINKELKKKEIVAIPEKKFRKLFGAITLGKQNLLKEKLKKQQIIATWKYGDNYITFLRN